MDIEDEAQNFLIIKISTKSYIHIDSYF